MAAQAAQQSLISFTGLELFFIGATLLSLFFNLWQFMAARRNKAELLKPLLNSLTGFFNDVKAKTFSVQDTQNILFHPQNPHKDVDTLRWEYFRFAGSIIDTLRGYQETLVAALVTLNPKDKEGAMTFKAADYGLSSQEKDRRDQFLRQRVERQMGAADQTKPNQGQ